MMDPQKSSSPSSTTPQQPLEQAAVLRGRGSGLISTVDDFLAFYRMLLNKGLHGRDPHPVATAVELMMSDQLTQNSAGARNFSSATALVGGWAVRSSRAARISSPRPAATAGTRLRHIGHLDPAEDVVGILMTQRMMEQPQPPRVFTDFWTSAYQSIDD